VKRKQGSRVSIHKQKLSDGQADVQNDTGERKEGETSGDREGENETSLSPRRERIKQKSGLSWGPTGRGGGAKMHRAGSGGKGRISLAAESRDLARGCQDRGVRKDTDELDT